MSDRPTRIAKQLSHNDTGETGGHQAGILVPRTPHILAFFPRLDPTNYNPRHELWFTDPHGRRWAFNFIYYNSRLFGGTRNEYRLTRMIQFMRDHNLSSGDTLILSRDEEHRLRVDYRRQDEPADGEVLKIGTTWRIVQL